MNPTTNTEAGAVVRERRHLRVMFKLGWQKPKADKTLADYAAKGTHEYAAIVAEAKRLPAEFFSCRECNSGPWHITYGGCPNCMGL